MLDKLITGEKLVDEWDTLGAKRIELNVYQRQGKIYSGNILLLCPTHNFAKKFSAVYDGTDSTKMNWIDNFLFSTVNELGESITSWDDVDNLPSSIIEIQATTLSSGLLSANYNLLERKLHFQIFDSIPVY